MDFRKIFLLAGIVTTVFLFTRCFRGQLSADPRGAAYAGSVECVRCHGSVSGSYAHTAHFLSTRVANEISVAGNFSRDSNEIVINNSTKIVMEKKDSGLYQVLYRNNRPISAYRFDLVMGAVKGQTYLYRQGDRFFELPVSYFTALNRWTSSPGYDFAHLTFNRPVVKECFECHSSFANVGQAAINKSDIEKSWILNIDCERCHGPATAHVQFHDAHPEEKQSRFLVSFKTLSRAQKIDLCAVCHSGTKHILLKSTFGFKMGDSLSSYRIPLSTGDQVDVHGNQTQLLSQSKCFRMSNMDCSTCHNAHVNERELVQNFNHTCQNCHAPGQHFCGMANDSNIVFIKNNCTGCHMPAQASRAIVVQAANNTLAVPNLVVNHRIAIYREETARIMKTKVHDHSIQR
jgi:Cytochrome c554 and c-prime